MAYVVPRDHFWMLICVVALLFLGYVPLVQAAKGFNLKQLLVVAALFRVAFVVSTPALSDDFYRFFWDGRMWWHGAHPLSATPDDLHTIKASEAWDPHQDLWNGLNSREYSTVYPPASQFLFALAAGGGMRSVATELMLLRLLLVALELLAVYLLYLILPLLGRPPTASAWYAFNPLVIIEVAGNLHFEGAMTTCVLWAIWGWLASNPDARRSLGCRPWCWGWPPNCCRCCCCHCCRAWWGGGRPLCSGSLCWLDVPLCLCPSCTPVARALARVWSCSCPV